jgi:hypothetical protein
VSAAAALSPGREPNGRDRDLLAVTAVMLPFGRVILVFYIAVFKQFFAPHGLCTAPHQLNYAMLKPCTALRKLCNAMLSLCTAAVSFCNAL